MRIRTFPIAAILTACLAALGGCGGGSTSAKPSSVPTTTSTTPGLTPSAAQPGVVPVTLPPSTTPSTPPSIPTTPPTSPTVSASTPASGASSVPPTTSPVSTLPAPVYSSFQSIATPWPVWQSGNVVTPPCSLAGCHTYYISPTGSDSNNGTSLATAFATFAQAVAVVQPGDTVLIGAGTYHQVLNVLNVPGGATGKPITFGSYGDGPVVIDASPVPAQWSQVNGSVWQASGLSEQPMAVVINGAALKPALSSSYTASSSPPPTNPAAVTSGSGLWAYSGGTLTVDFGSTAPSAADIVIPSASNPSPIYWYGVSDLVFNGLTARGSGNGGIWGYGNNITVSDCVSEFNTKGGINFMGNGAIANSGNQALDNLVYMNAMHNWPRGNNGFAFSGGGWSGGLVFTDSLNGLARGNIVANNGGEGIISYGSSPGTATGGTVFEQNVSMNNWSTNMYFDNQPNDIARQNIVYFSGYDPSTWIQPYDPSTYPWNTMYKFNAGISIGDECGSSGANPCTANLANTQVEDNLIVGFRIGIAEYWEGNAMLQNPTNLQHGLKNTLIANNTIILPTIAPPGTYSIGLYLWNNTTSTGANPNTNSFVLNNLIVGWSSPTSADSQNVIWYQGNGADPGVTVNNNAYWNPNFANTFNLGFNSTVVNDTFSQWQAASGNDAKGLFTDPGLTNLQAMLDPGYPNTPVSTPYDYHNAIPQSGSPILGKGMNLSAFSAIPGDAFGTNLSGQSRGANWSIGAF